MCQDLFHVKPKWWQKNSLISTLCDETVKTVQRRKWEIHCRAIFSSNQFRVEFSCKKVDFTQFLHSKISQFPHCESQSIISSKQNIFSRMIGGSLRTSHSSGSTTDHRSEVFAGSWGCRGRCRSSGLFSSGFGTNGLKHSTCLHEILDVLTQNVVFWPQL